MKTKKKWVFYYSFNIISLTCSLKYNRHSNLLCLVLTILCKSNFNVYTFANCLNNLMKWKVKFSQHCARQWPLKKKQKIVAKKIVLRVLCYSYIKNVDRFLLNSVNHNCLSFLTSLCWFFLCYAIEFIP